VSLLLRAITLVALALTFSACGSDSPEALGSAQQLTPDSAPDAGPDAGSQPADPGRSACEEVVAGINAFNAGDFDETVARFEQAVPLAEAEDAAAGTLASADLLEAVRYYAELAPEDYPEASLTSRDFATYKAITLGQCLSGQGPGPDDGGGIQA
jgi:hypothetical protein